MQKILFGFILIISLALPLVSKGATLKLETASGMYGPGDSFAVDVKIDLDTGCINTVDAEIAFDKNYLVMEDFLSGDSLLSIWLKMPKDADFRQINDSGLIRFTGGIPGGYCGKVSGDPGGRSDVVGRIIFKVPNLIVGEDSETSLSFTENTGVFLNDGLGTPDTVSHEPLTIGLAQNKSVLDESWQEQIKSDKTPPEPFVVEVHRNQTMFGGRYYIIFSTLDKQSGLDRYEIMETDLSETFTPREKKWYERIIGEKEPVKSDWITADMPYPLRDQTLMSVIKVRAIDKAGNERTVEYFPPKELREQARASAYQKDATMLLFIIGGGIAVLVLAAFFILKFLKKRKYAKETNI